MSSWAGVPIEDRTSERRARLLAAALTLVEAGDEAVTVRATIREAGLNPRYFYESFDSIDQLLGALFDQQSDELQARLEATLAAVADDPTATLRTGIETVLRFLTEDPRRARVLVSGWPTSAALIERRRESARALSTQAAASARAVVGDQVDPLVVEVFSTMFAGSMGALADAWASGRLGDDLSAVVDRAVGLTTAMAAPTPEAPAS